MTHTHTHKSYCRFRWYLKLWYKCNDQQFHFCRLDDIIKILLQRRGLTRNSGARLKVKTFRTRGYKGIHRFFCITCFSYNFSDILGQAVLPLPYLPQATFQPHPVKSSMGVPPPFPGISHCHEPGMRSKPKSTSSPSSCFLGF